MVYGDVLQRLNLRQRVSRPSGGTTPPVLYRYGLIPFSRASYQTFGALIYHVSKGGVTHGGAG